MAYKAFVFNEIMYLIDFMEEGCKICIFYELHSHRVHDSDVSRME